MSFLSDNMLGILITSLILLMCLFIRKRLDYFSSRAFPQVKLSVVDLMKSLLMSSLNHRPIELYKKERDKGNPCVGFFHTLLTPAVLVLDPALVQTILIKDFSSFHDHGIEIDTNNDPLAGHLFNMKGDQWRTLRNKLLPTFTSGKLKGMLPSMDSCGRQFIDSVKQDILRKEVNLKELFKGYTLSVIASCVFAIDPASIKDPNCEFVKLLNKVLDPGLSMILKMSMILAFPKLAKFLKIKAFPRHVDDFFIKLTKDALEIRKSSGVKRNDFVQLLLELKERGSVEMDVRDLEEDEVNVQQKAEYESSNSKLEITYELLSAQALVFIVAGFENTSFLAAITMYLLGKHKDIQKRVREEVREALSKHGGMNYMALRDMKLLSATIDECLRLHPPAIFLLRQCNKSYTLSNGMKIEKGMQIFIPSKAFQTDSKFWLNAEKFDPERFLTSDIKPGTYLPFGDGPRICIAQRLVLLMAKVIMAEVLVNFDLEASSRTKEPLQPKSLSTADVVGGLWGSFLPLH